MRKTYRGWRPNLPSLCLKSDSKYLARVIFSIRCDWSLKSAQPVGKREGKVMAIYPSVLYLLIGSGSWVGHLTDVSIAGSASPVCSTIYSLSSCSRSSSLYSSCGVNITTLVCKSVIGFSIWSSIINILTCTYPSLPATGHCCLILVSRHSCHQFPLILIQKLSASSHPLARDPVEYCQWRHLCTTYCAHSTSVIQSSLCLYGLGNHNDWCRQHLPSNEKE